jgi:hypothetical protein
VDKTITNAHYEIEIDPATKLPVRIAMVILTGTRGSTESKDKKIVGGKHVAFHFDYRLSDFGKLKRPAIPPEAQRLLARS